MPNRKPKRRPPHTITNQLKQLVAWYRQHPKLLHRFVRHHPGNPAPIDPSHPHAPKSHPLPKAKKPLPETSTAHKIVNLCHESLRFAGKMIYTEDLAARRELFHRKSGEFLRAHADCSQFGASILHWLGNTLVNDTDATGSLWNKGKLLAGPKIGCGVIFGEFPGQHFGFVTGKVPGGGDWYVVGFGHQGAPDRNTLSDLETYFRQRGFPGTRFLDFTNN
jgi:hypothetical protein